MALGIIHRGQPGQLPVAMGFKLDRQQTAHRPMSHCAGLHTQCKLEAYAVPHIRSLHILIGVPGQRRAESLGDFDWFYHAMRHAVGIAVVQIPFSSRVPAAQQMDNGSTRLGVIGHPHADKQ